MVYMTKGFPLLYALIVILYLIPVNAYSLYASAVKEDIDMRDPSIAYSRVLYIFESNDISRISVSQIKNICNYKRFKKCQGIYNINKATVGFEASFTPEIKILSVKKEGREVSIEFEHNYSVMQYFFGKGISTLSRKLTIRYPTHIFTYDKPSMDKVSNTFVVKKGFKNFLPDITNRNITAGEIITITNLNGSICYAELRDRDNIITSYTNIGCSNFPLATKTTLPEGRYNLVVLSYSPEEIFLYETEIYIMEPDAELNILLESYDIYAGSPIKIYINNDEPPERCTASVYDISGNLIERSSFSQCNTILLGSESSWGDGEYIIEVSAENGDKIATASATVYIHNPQASEPPSVELEKTEYFPGDTVSVISNFAGSDSYCVTRLYDQNYNTLAQTESFGCEKTELRLDESLEPGVYLIKTELYRKGRLRGYDTTSIEILPWEPYPGSWMEQLCQGGKFVFEDTQLPCITPKQICHPTTIQTPLCLCFDSKGDIKDVCNYGDICGEFNCKKGFISPYTIIINRNQCYAYKGDLKLECIYRGEICSGNCVCLDENNNPIGKCGPGTVCSINGCSEPELIFEPHSFEPKSAREKDITETGVEFSWKGILKDKTGILSHFDNIDIEIKVAGISADKESIEIKQLENNIVQIKGKIKGSIPPGKYPIYLIFKRGDSETAVKKEFSVFYNDKRFIIKFRSFEPEEISGDRMLKDATIRFKFNIFTKNGVEIKQLPVEAFNIEVEDVITRSISSNYDGTNYVVVGYIYSKKLLRGKKDVTLTVDYLGRKAVIKKSINILAKEPLTLGIMKIDPGTRSKPLFYMLVGTGFDIDLYLHITGINKLEPSMFNIKINRKDVSSNIAYIVNTVNGIKMRISDIHLCPEHPPAPDTEIPLEVTVTSGSETVKEKTYIYVKGNAGNWSNLKQAGC